uniref:Uncharacterized protein n=1 Tax=Rhizophora mucronata TaxID=61149 RepID=A0A2P2QHI5_RHIMU
MLMVKVPIFPVGGLRERT